MIAINITWMFSLFIGLTCGLVCGFLIGYFSAWLGDTVSGRRPEREDTTGEFTKRTKKGGMDQSARPRAASDR